MTDYPQWSTIKPLLDDPNVSNADKQRLLNSYAQQAGYGTDYGAGVNQDYVNNQNEITQYAQQYNATDAFSQADQVSSSGDPNAVAQNQASGLQTYQSQLQRAQNDQQTATANTDLTTAAGKTVAQGGSGVNSTDDILGAGSRGMHFFEYFIPPYKSWTGNAPDLAKDIETVFDNLRSISLGKFRADATQLSTSHGKLSDITLNLSTDTNSLGGFWQGAAAQAAQQYCGTFVQNAKTVTDGTSAASQVISDSMKAIETAVLQRSQAVLKMYATDIGGFSPDDIQQIIIAAKNQASDDQLRAMSKWAVFSNVDWGDTNCDGSLSQNLKNLVAMDATNWLNQTFVPTFDQKKQSFDQICTSTHDAVSQSFDSMNQALGQIQANPFSDLSAGIQVPASTSSGPPASSQPAPGPGSSPGGGGPTTPSSFGAPSGPGSGPATPSAPTPSTPGPTTPSSFTPPPSPGGPGTSGPTTPSTPSVPTPSTPSTSGPTLPTSFTPPPSTGGPGMPGPTTPGTFTPPSTGGPGTPGPTMPTTFTPPSTGGPGMPGIGIPTTGMPGSGIPTTGMPGSGTPETLTVQHGNSTLSMTSPDSTGTMQLTTTDANGHPKTYDIGFGTGSGHTGPGLTGAGLPGTGTAGSPTGLLGSATGLPPGSVTGLPGSGPGLAGAGVPTTGFGPTGTPVPGSITTDANGVQHVTPGADGTAVIHDGNTTITAQQEQGGQVKVTVDDGTGQPTTYTLGATSQTGAIPAGGPTFGAPTDPTAAQSFGAPSQTGAVPAGGPTFGAPTDPAAAQSFGAVPAQSVGAPTDPNAGQGFTSPVAPAGSTSIPAQTVGYTTQQAGFTDPSTMAGAGAPGYANPSTSDVALPVANNQSTALSAALSNPAGSGLGGAVGGGPGDASAFAQGFGGGTSGGLHSAGLDSAVGGAVGGSHAVADGMIGQHQQHVSDVFGGGTHGHAGVAGTNVTPMGPPGSAQVASAPSSALDQSPQGGQPQQPGMPMGGMGGGGGQGGDQQRGGQNQWKTHGRLFDDVTPDETIGRFSGTLDDGR